LSTTRKEKALTIVVSFTILVLGWIYGVQHEYILFPRDAGLVFGAILLILLGAGGLSLSILESILKIRLAWRPKINSVAGVILAVLLGLIIFSYLIMAGYYEAHYGGFPTRFERIRIVYAAADQTTREIFCKLCNTGNTFAILEEVWVNGTKVSTRDPLPITMESFLDYKTIVFGYNGTWEGSILISVRTRAAYNFNGLVDLQAASRNPIGGAYPSTAELQQVYLEHHLGEVAQAVFFGSYAALVAEIVLLVSRSRRKAINLHRSFFYR